MSSAAKLLIASAVSAAFLSACSSVDIAPVEDRSGSVEASAASTAPAPAAPAAPAAEVIPLGGDSAASGTGTYTVKPGDTLYRIAKNHGVNVNELMRTNGITDPSKLPVGRVLTIPGGVASVHHAAAPVPAPAVASHTATHAAAAEPAPAHAAPAAEAPSAKSGAKMIPGTQETLLWPLKGRFVKAFSAESRGIDIAVDRGTSVKAAAAGEVLLVSSSFKGYGNLVILRHGDGSFVTTYGQLSSISVEKGTRVKAGQVIGKSGGLDASNPVLHFEVRIAGKPVDPKEYLP